MQISARGCVFEKSKLSYMDILIIAVRERKRERENRGGRGGNIEDTCIYIHICKFRNESGCYEILRMIDRYTNVRPVVRLCE